MAIQSFQEIMADLKKRIYRPVYLLMGDESYFIDQVSDYIAGHVLTEDERAFNQTILYGNQNDELVIDNTARRYPMMASHQVVIVREAQTLKNIDKLEPYVSRPLNSTILVLNYRYGTLDKRKKLYKAILDKGIILESKRLYENHVPAWVGEYLKPSGIAISPHATQMLVEFLGTDLKNISNALDKILIAVSGKKNQIGPEEVEQHCGFSREFNNFELQAALGRRDLLKAFRIAKYFADNPKDNPILVTNISLYRFFANLLILHGLPDKSKNSVANALKINPFFVDQYYTAARSFSLAQTMRAIGILRQYDMRLKGVQDNGTEPGELLREMLSKMLA